MWVNAQRRHGNTFIFDVKGWFGRAQYAETQKHAGRLINVGLINFDMGDYNIQHAGRLVKMKKVDKCWFDQLWKVDECWFDQLWYGRVQYTTRWKIGQIQKYWDWKFKFQFRNIGIEKSTILIIQIQKYWNWKFKYGIPYMWFSNDYNYFFIIAP